MIVADSSVLIVLSKIGSLRLLQQLHNNVMIVPAVKEEVVDGGREIGAPDIAYVEAAIAEQWIVVADLDIEEVRLARRLMDTTRLHQGEAESLVVANSREMTLLVDDKEARTVARAMNVRFTGTIGLILEAYSDGYMEYNEFEQSVRELSAIMWLSPDVIVNILTRIGEVRGE